VAVAAAAATIAILPAGGRAGRFRTENAEPLGVRELSFAVASTATFSSKDLNGSIPQLEVDYGVVPRLELGLTLPYAIASRDDGERVRHGIGDAQLGFKLQLAREAEAGVALAIAPVVTFPTGAESSNLGDGRVTALLPVAVQKSFGDWTTYASAGFRIRAAPSAERIALGWAVERRTGPVVLGAEVYRQTDSPRTLAGRTGFSLGVLGELSRRHRIAASAGAGRHLRDVHAYVAWEVRIDGVP
jgi:hypothetical protein